MKRCPKCGGTEFQVHQIEDHVIVVTGEGEFVSEKSSYTEIMHEPTDEDIWQCDNCDYTATGKSFNMSESKLTEDNVAEFKGQFVDILEDLLNDYNAYIPNEERDEAIDEGEDPEGLAIIYGSDYDIIGDVVEDIANRVMSADSAFESEKAVNEIMLSYEQIVKKTEPLTQFSFTDICTLKEIVTSTLSKWGIDVV